MSKLHYFINTFNPGWFPCSDIHSSQPVYLKVPQAPLFYRALQHHNSPADELESSSNFQQIQEAF